MPLPTRVRYTWNLAVLPATTPPLDKCYQFSLAKACDEEALLTALTRAYTTELGWSTEMDESLARIAKLVDNRLADGTADFLVLRHGSRIIAGSALIDNPEAPEQFASGVCVLDEYRCRGLGTYLLYQSLLRLKEAGLGEASAMTKIGITADRYLYGKFGGQREVIQPEEAVKS